MPISDRILELRRVRAGDLAPSADNWREHPESQRKALQGILAEVGYTDAVLTYTAPDGRLTLFDGHLRQSLDPEQVIPVLVTDLSEAEARKMMAVLDPLACMAEANAEKLAALIAEIETESADVRAILEALAAENPEIRADASDLPDILETTRHTVVVPYDDTDVPALKTFLGVDSLPDSALGKAINERIKAIAAGGEDRKPRRKKTTRQKAPLG